MPRLWSGAVWWWIFFLLDKTAPYSHATSSFFFHFCRVPAVGAYSCLPFWCSWCSVDFLWVSAWLKGFFPHTGGVFFPLHFTFRLRRCCWSGPLGYLPNFCLAWRHLNQASKPALGLWILALHAEHVGNLQMFDLDPLIWLRTKHIPNFLKAFGYIESSHQIVLMNSPLNGEHLPEICASGYANPSKPLDANLP